MYPFLKTGTIVHCFQSEGKTPDDKDLLNNKNKGSTREQQHDFTRSGGTPSGQGSLDTLKLI